MTQDQTCSAKICKAPCQEAPKTCQAPCMLDLPKIRDDVLVRDYQRQATKTLKFSGDFKNGGSWEYKASAVGIECAEKAKTCSEEFPLTCQDSLSFNFPYKKLNFEVAKKCNHLELRTDFGTLNVFNQDFDLSTTLKTDQNLKNHGICLTTKFTKGNFSGKLKGMFCTKSHSFTLVDSWLYRKNKFLVGGSGVFDCAKPCSKGGALLFGFEDECGGLYAKSFFGATCHSVKNVVLTGIWNKLPACEKTCVKACNLGVEVDINKDGAINSATFGVQKTLANGVVLKSKIDQKLRMSFVVKEIINETISLTIGGRLPLCKLANFRKEGSCPLTGPDGCPLMTGCDVSCSEKFRRWMSWCPLGFTLNVGL